jgi:hypothetical protein
VRTAVSCAPRFLKHLGVSILSTLSRIPFVSTLSRSLEWAGQPIFVPETKVVRIALLGGRDGGAKLPDGEEFELKQVVRDLFAAPVRLNNGIVVRLEIQRGLPRVLETTSAC